jgi:protein-tyrosine phosphatase
MAGKLPVLAHPERYQRLWTDERLVEQLRGEVAFVIDLGAVAGYHGKKEHKAARRYLEDGIAHAVASDAHTPEDVARAAEGIAWIKKRLGPAAVTRLLDTNPRRILAGELPD